VSKPPGSSGAPRRGCACIASEQSFTDPKQEKPYVHKQKTRNTARRPLFRGHKRGGARPTPALACRACSAPVPDLECHVPVPAGGPGRTGFARAGSRDLSLVSTSQPDGVEPSTRAWRDSRHVTRIPCVSSRHVTLTSRASHGSHVTCLASWHVRASAAQRGGGPAAAETPPLAPARPAGGAGRPAAAKDVALATTRRPVIELDIDSDALVE
jgi:hypothetical protein